MAGWRKCWAELRLETGCFQLLAQPLSRTAPFCSPSPGMALGLGCSTPPSYATESHSHCLITTTHSKTHVVAHSMQGTGGWVSEQFRIRLPLWMQPSVSAVSPPLLDLLLTCYLGFRGEVLGLLSPRRGMHGHAPVAPCADVVVFGCHLDDVLLARVGIGDDVGRPV